MPKCHTSANLLQLGWARATLATVAVLLAIIYCGCISGSARASTESQFSAVLMSLKANSETIVLNFDRPVDVKITHLDGPQRIIIDLPQTNFEALDQGVSLPELVDAIRFGLMSPDHSRIILTLSIPAIVTNDKGSSASDTHQLNFKIVDIAAFATRANEDAAASNVMQTTKSDRVVDSNQADGRFTVIIDPGHGGIDTGAQGSLGTKEKDITLAFGLALREALKADPNIRVIMTRDSDVFIGLHQRVKIGRQNGAELFLSIHGDSIALTDIRGATIYTLSDSASDAISSALAKQENLADSIAGLPPMKPDPETNSILVDLLKQETATFSRELASQIVVHLQENAVELINNPVRAAGFSVLTAPDVPSLLLEMGYLSNQKDELLLRDPKWRMRTAQVIAKAIQTYAKGHRTKTVQP